MKKLHDIKIWSVFFDEVQAGRKMCEIRKNDRDYEVGDILNLREFDPEGQKRTGRSILVEVVHILEDTCVGVDRGYCVMSIIPCNVVYKTR